MKKKGLTTVIALLGAAVACVEVEVILPEVSHVYISASSKTVAAGSTFVLDAYAVPSNAKDTAIVWTSSNTDVATVSHGTVHALATGTATITASTAGGVSAGCALTVVAQVVPVRGVSLESAALELTPGDTVTVSATITPLDATDKSVAWTVDNEEIAVVYSNTVKALKTGTTTLRARTLDGGLTASRTIRVTSGKPEKNSSGSTESLGGTDGYEWTQ